MTEAEWLACTDTAEMWMCLPHPRSRRVATLFAVACVRATPQAGSQPLLLTATETIERVVDSGDWVEVDTLNEQASKECGEVELESAAHHWALAALRLTSDSIDYYAMHVPLFMVKAIKNPFAIPELSQRYADLLRDVFGKPIRNGRGKRMRNPTKKHPFPVLRDSHITSTVIGLARQMYDSRDFSAMPILADALQDVGCDNEDILNHCRQPGVHVRGCWLVDALLAKG
jgi:hypothetical protein